MKHPERFVGMHFFNPVEQMPLVEIIPSKKTKPEVIATIVALAKKAGKTPIIVNDCPGFLVNRILLPYINECAKIVDQGESVERIDTLIENFGMPMGPFVLADTVGLDVGYKVASVLSQGYGERMEVSKLLDRAYNELHLLGKKANKGFYIHEGKNKRLNPDIDALKSEKIRFTDDEIVDRAILIMVNEAAYCLAEGIVKNAQHLDVAMIMGTGFPPFRGGLLKYADDYGLEKVLHSLLRLRDKHGMRFEPAPLLQELAQKGSTFYKGIK
jgi:3-hydroxyacyl-CoA dehydrogenase/enoyl-CoA hydratase/3-hydroxybutyryl-CoA epimerase